MSAIFRINQDGVQGDWGKARADLALFSASGVVEIEAQDSGQVYLWEMLSEAEGSSISITNPTSQVAEISFTVRGGYIVRLTVNAGTVDEDILTLYLGVPLANSGLPIPAFNETIQDNRASDGTFGYEKKLNAFLSWVDSAAGGPAGMFEPGTGTNSVKNIAGTNTVGGTFDFVMGTGNTTGGGGSYNRILGLNSVIGSACGSNFMVGSSNSVADGSGGSSYNVTIGSLNVIAGGSQRISVLGSYNALGSGTDVVVLARDLAISGGSKTNSLFSGRLHSYDSSGSSIADSTIMGYSHRFFTSTFSLEYSFVGGRGHSIGVGGSDITILGRSNGVVPFNKGTTISLSFSGGTVMLTDSTYPFVSALDGRSIVISGATNAGNNGTFTLTYTGGNTITFTNASGVSESSNADLKWQIDGTASGTVFLAGLTNYCWSGGFGNSFVVGTGNAGWGGGGLNSVVSGTGNILRDGGGSWSLITGSNNEAFFGSANNLIAGQKNTVQASSYGIYAGDENVMNTCTASVIAGRLNDIAGGQYCLAAGQGNVFSGLIGGIVAGYQNASTGTFYYGIVSGTLNQVSGDYSIIAGRSNTFSASEALGIGYNNNTDGDSQRSVFAGQSNVSRNVNMSFMNGDSNFFGLTRISFVSTFNSTMSEVTQSFISGEVDFLHSYGSDSSNISLSFSGGTVTLTDTAASFNGAYLVGRQIRLGGCDNGGNNGLFTVVSVISATELTFTNASGVTESGAGTRWYADAGSPVTRSLVLGDTLEYKGYLENTILIGDLLGSATQEVYMKYSVVVGYDNYVLGDGTGNIIVGSDLWTYGDHNLIVGDGNHTVAGYSYPSVKNSYNVVLGQNCVIGGTHNKVFGYDNNICLGSDASVLAIHNFISGVGNELARESGYNVWFGSNNVCKDTTDDSSILKTFVVGDDNILGRGDNGSFESNFILGNSNSFNPYNDSDDSIYTNNFIIGFDNKYHIDSSYTTQNNIVMGWQNRAGKGYNNHIFGQQNSVIPYNKNTTGSISAPSSNIQTLTDPDGYFIPLMDGLTIEIIGSSGVNNGTFTLTYISSTQVSYTNASGVEDLTGIEWKISGGGGSNNVAIFGRLNVSTYSGGAYGIIAGRYNFLTNNGISYGITCGQNNYSTNSGGASSVVAGEGNEILNSANMNFLAGVNNTMTNGASRSVVVGQNNTMTNSAADCVLTGDNVTATSGTQRSVLCGNVVSATGSSNSFIGGQNMTTSGASNSVAVGYGNTVTSSMGVTFGRGASNYIAGSITSAGGHPSDYAAGAAGQAQGSSQIIHSCHTTDATPTRLYLDGNNASSNFTTISDHAYTLDTIITAKCISGASAGGAKLWHMSILINNISGTLTVVGTDLLGTEETSIANEASWSISPQVYDTNVLSFQATGVASETIRWTCNTRLSEVGVS